MMKLKTQPRNRWTSVGVIAGLWCAAATLAFADAPLLIHYQGRLTSDAGVPVTDPTGFVFSLWRGGTAGAANSGTLLYSESAMIDPDAQGIFEHQVGNGAPLSGTLTAGAFDTAEPVYLQVAAGTSSNVLLPRARVTSVGYALVATNAVGDITPRSVSIAGFGPVIDAQGRWTGSAEGLPGNTGLSLTDLTGGLTVVGDRIAVTGTNLADARVEVGGRPAGILSQTATRLEFRVPGGVIDGVSAVMVVAPSGATRLAGYLDVRRRLVWVTPFITAIVDARTRSLVTTLNYTISTDKLPVQMAFAFDGAVGLVPGNNAGNMLQIDMTANPPSGTIVSLGVNSNRAIAVSPDNRLAAVSVNSSGANFLRLLTLRDPALGNLIQSSVNFQFPANFSGPRGSVFVGDNMLIVAGETSGELLALRRNVANNSLFFQTFTLTSPFLRNRVAAGSTPVSLRVTADRMRLVLVNRNQTNISVYFLAPEGFSGQISSASGGLDALDVAISPDGNAVFTVEEDQDLLHAYNLTGGQLTQVGYMEGLPNNQTDLTLNALEPVAGDLLAIGTDNSTLRFYDRDGMVLTFLDQISLSGTNRRTIELEFQP